MDLARPADNEVVCDTVTRAGSVGRTSQGGQEGLQDGWVPTAPGYNIMMALPLSHTTRPTPGSVKGGRVGGGSLKPGHNHLYT